MGSSSCGRRYTHERRQVWQSKWNGSRHDYASSATRYFMAPKGREVGRVVVPVPMSCTFSLTASAFAPLSFFHSLSFPFTLFFPITSSPPIRITAVCPHKSRSPVRVVLIWGEPGDSEPCHSKSFPTSVGLRWCLPVFGVNLVDRDWTGLDMTD